MAIETAYNFKVVVNSVDLSDHCTALKMNYGQGSNEAQASGDVHKKYRAGIGDFGLDATFRADHAVGSVNATLRPLITPASTGFAVLARYKNTTRSSSNEEYSFEAIIDGDLMALNEEHGAVPEISVRFVPFGTVSVLVTTT